MIQMRSRKILPQLGGISAVDLVAVGLLVLASLVSTLGAFAYIDGSSFWLDELDSIFGAAGSLRDVFEKSVRYDTHPPLYEYFLHFWIAAFGDSEASVRFPSAVAATLLVPAWYWATRPVLSPWAALLLPAMCVTTLFWFDQSQQARVYSLVQLDLALSFGFLVRAVCATTNQNALRNSTCMILLSLLAAFFHFYAFMISGVLILTALLLVKRLGARLVLFSGGGLIFALMLLFLFVRRNLSELHFQELWFFNNWKSLNVWLSYPTAFAGSFAGALVIFVMIAVFGVGWWQKRYDLRSEIQSNPVLKLALAAIAVPVFVSGTAILLAFGGMPTLQARNASLMAPFFWFAMIALADWGHQMSPRWIVHFSKLTSAVLMLAASSIAIYRPLSQRENWRGAGHAVLASPGCAGSTVYVTNADTFAAMLKITPAVYGYYAPGISFKVIGSDQIFDSKVLRTLAEKSRDIAMGRTQCPIVLWSAHSYSEGDGIRIKDAIAGALQSNSVRLTFESFPHWRVRSMHQPELFSDVFLISASRQNRANE